MAVYVQQKTQQDCLPPFSKHTAPQAENYITDLWSCSCWFLIALVSLSYVFVAAWPCMTNTCQVGSQWFALQCIVLLFTMPPISVLRTVFGRNVLSPPPHASLNLTGTVFFFFFFFSIKNVLFLAHCVKTWPSHPVYVCAHWNNLRSPEGLVSSATCTETLFAVLHTACIPNYAMLCISRGATRPEWQPALPITLPLISPFSHFFPVV